MSEQKKVQLYRALGAEQFQKAVFTLERVKYQVIEKCFPNIISWYEKQCDRQFIKKIKKEKIQDYSLVLTEYQKEKLAFRREIVYKQNRNYHYNPNYPTKFVKYLEMNKKIHQRGIKKNITVLMGVGIVSLILSNPLPIASIVVALLQVVSMIINFECINLQNYNLCRFENTRMENILTKIEEKKLNCNLQKLNEGMKPISEVLISQIEIPSIDQVIEQVTTRTQAKQLLEYMKEQLTYLEQTKIAENKKMRRKL